MNQFLTETDLREKAPSIFATEPDKDVSEKYSFVPSDVMVEYFDNLGWYPVSAVQQGAKEETDLIHARHEIKFRNPSYGDIDGLAPELSWTNSHNRYCKAIMGVGFFRWICSNGLWMPIEGMKAEGLVKRHMGFTFEQFKAEVESRVISFDHWINEVNGYQTIELSPVEKNVFAYKAKNMRWGENSTIEADQLLVPRRVEDEGNDLWSVFNVLQENVIKGGIKYNLDNDRSRTTQDLNEIYKTQKINRDLWTVMAGIYNNRRAN